MRRWGIRHLFVWTEASRSYLARNGFVERWREGLWSDFELLGVDTREVVTTSGSGRLTALDSLGGTVALTGVTANSAVVIRAHYYPAWRAFVQGREVPLYPVDGQLAFTAPADGSYEVRLEYPRYRWLSLLAIAAACLGFWLLARPFNQAANTRVGAQPPGWRARHAARGSVRRRPRPPAGDRVADRSLRTLSARRDRSFAALLAHDVLAGSRARTSHRAGDAERAHLSGSWHVVGRVHAARGAGTRRLWRRASRVGRDAQARRRAEDHRRPAPARRLRGHGAPRGPDDGARAPSERRHRVQRAAHRHRGRPGDGVHQGAGRSRCW